MVTSLLGGYEWLNCQERVYSGRQLVGKFLNADSWPTGSGDFKQRFNFVTNHREPVCVLFNWPCAAH